MDKLTDDDKLQGVKIMGSIDHPIFQSKLRVLAVGLWTATKYEAGHSYLLDRMAYYFERGIIIQRFFLIQ